ncbi:MAG: hypothetical protein AB8B55_01920 [Mariniblastus sp.]
MIGIGFFEFLIPILLMFGGNLGIPMGMSPGPEDPMMSRVAPDDIYGYASWSGVAEVDAKSNPTEKWMAQPKVRSFGNKLRDSLWDMFETKADRMKEPVPRGVSKLLLEVGRIGSVRPGAVYASEVAAGRGKLAGGFPEFQGGFVISLGERAPDVQKVFDDLLAITPKFEEDSGFTYQVVEIDGDKVITADSPRIGFPMYLHLKDDYFFIGLGSGSVAEFNANRKTDSPQWLKTLRETIPVERVSSVAFMDIDRVGDAVKDEDWFKTDEFMSGLFDKFVDVQSVGWVSGLDDQGFLTRVDLRKDRATPGLLSVIDLDPIPPRFIKDIPLDTTFALATRISSERIMDLMGQAMGASGEAGMEEALGEFQKFTGVKLEEELLQAVGDFVFAHYKFDVGKLFTQQGWVASIRIDDEMSFPAIYDRLNNGLRKWVKGREEQAEFKVQKDGLNEIYSFVPTSGFGKFAWCVVDDQWYFASVPGDIIAHLKGCDELKDTERWANHAAVKELYAFGDKEGLGAPVAMFSSDLSPVIRAAFPFLVGPVRGDVRLLGSDWDLRQSDVPSVDELTNEVQPNFSGVFKTKTGFQLYQRQTYPGASPLVTLFSAAAIALGGESTRMKEK